MKTTSQLISIRTAGLRAFLRKIALILALAGAVDSLNAQSIIASGAVSGVQASPGVYDYTLVFSEGTGTTTPIHSIWYAWIPGFFYLPGTPSSASGPTGWTATPVANSIQFQSTAGAFDIAPGGSMTFGFVASFSPAQLAVAPNSGLSFAYAGAVNASTPNQEFNVVAAVPEPSTLALLLSGSAALLGLARWRKPGISQGGRIGEFGRIVLF